MSIVLLQKIGSFFDMIKKVVLIGTGNVAWHLAHSLPLFGYCVVQIFGRDADKAQGLALEIGADYTADYNEIYVNADFYIYAVTDNALSQVIDNIKVDSGVHIHTSGSVDIDVFEGKKSNYGVVYPLQTFIRNKKIDFSKIAIFIEANSADTMPRVEEFAKKLSFKIFDTDSRQRRQVHLAAVVACNFTNYLWQVANDLLKENHFPFRDVMLPLIEESVDKLKYMSPTEAQTGPAVRQDTDTIAKHIRLLEDNDDLQYLYRYMSDLIIKSVVR